VEGQSDVKALSALWSGWKQQLGKKGWGIQLILLTTNPTTAKKLAHEQPRNWQPPEEQSQDRPPKRIVEDLFQRELKRRLYDHEL